MSPAELLEGLAAEAEGVLDRLIDARLLSQRKAREERAALIELTHGSLIRSWGRLARWIDESSEELALRAEIEQAAELWERRGARPDEAWQGAALADAERAIGRLSLELSERSSAFLEAGRRRVRRRSWQRRGLLAVGFVLLAAIALTFFFKERETAREKRRAESERRLAERQRQRAEDNRARAELEGARAAYSRGNLLEARSKLRGALERSDSRSGRALWAQLVADPRLWRHDLGSPIYAVALSPNGRWVAAAGQDSAIYLLEVRTRARRVLRGHRDQVRSLAFSHDSRRLASGSWSGQIFVWNLDRGTRRELRGHTRAVVDLAFHPKRAELASASWDRSFRLWHLAGQKPARVFRDDGGRVSSVAFSSDGAHLATASLGGPVRYRDANGRVLATFAGHRGGTIGVTFSPTGGRLASVGADAVVRLWDTKHNKQATVLAGPTGTLWGVRFAPNGQRVIAAGADGLIWIWSLKDGSRSALSGHGAGVREIDVSRDGHSIASVGLDKTARLWRLRAHTAISPTTSPVWGLSFSPDGKLLVTGSRDAKLRRWRVNDGQLLGTHGGHTSTVISTAVSPQGALIATGGGDKTVRLWKTSTGAPVDVLLGHRGDVFSVAFSPSGKLLASGGSDKTVRLWDPLARRSLRVVGGFGGAVWDVTFSPDGRTLAASSRDKLIRLIDPRSGRVLRTLKGHQAGVFGLAFSPDGRALISGSSDGTLRRWTLPAGRGEVFARVKGRFYFVDVDPSGRYVAATASDGVPRLYATATGKLLAQLRGHLAEANYLRFAPSGKLLASSSDDGTVRLWRVPSGRPFWHAPGIVLRGSRAAPLLFSHRGWRTLDTDKPLSPPTTRWRAAVEQAHGLSVDTKGQRLCLHRFDGRLELWDLRQDKPLFSDQPGELREVLALAEGCVTIGAKGARYYVADGSYRPLGKARTLARDGAGFLLAIGDGVALYDARGRRERSYASLDAGVTAMTRVGGKLLLGFANGSIEYAGGARISFERVPSSRVVRLRPGPQGTVIAGYANGLVGLWSLADGLRLGHTYLHGPARHLLLRQRRLYAVSDLGDRRVLRLDAFYVEACELLRDIWRQVPAIWDDGRPQLRPPPTTHRCAGEAR
jgi:WD40 repeat protein